MANPSTVLTRQEFFDLIWSKPGTHIAKEFGVPPAVVLKACTKFDIPRPTTGHWVKLQHGHQIAKPTLDSPGPHVPLQLSIAELTRTKRPRNAVEPRKVAPTPSPVEPEGEKWHPAVKATRAAYRGEGVHSTYGTLNAKIGAHHIHLTVTRNSLDRSLLLLNRLAWSLSEHGFSFETPKGNNPYFRLVHAATNEEVTFQLREEIKRHERPLTPEEKKKNPILIWDRWIYTPTGRLRLSIDDYYPQGVQKSWGDGKNTKLEDKLVDAAPAFVVCAQGQHELRLRREEQSRRWAEESRRRELEAARIKQEQERRAALMEMALNWTKAESLRTFRNACEAHLRGQGPAGTLTDIEARWLEWIDSVVRSTDPLISGLVAKLCTPQEGIAAKPAGIVQSG